MIGTDNNNNDKTNKHISALLFVATIGIYSTPGFTAEHDFEFGTRLRYADLQDNEQEGKSASALLRFSLESEWSEQFKTYIELDHVESEFKDEHSDGVRFNGQPVIPDVPGTEINQAFLQLNADQWLLKLGRQTIEFDNQRYIGSVSFWQNEQSFDAVFFQSDWLSSSHLNYAYIGNANRIFGDDADRDLDPSDVIYDALNGRRPAGNLGDHEQDTHLFRVEINEIDYSKIVLFSYLIDNQDAPAVSSNTYGGNYLLKYKPSTVQYRAEAEVATQVRTEIPGEPAPSYYRLEAGLGVNSIEFSWRLEVLGEDNGVPFFTPLGSLHEFAGWADKFNFPPSSGLKDQSFKIKWRKAPWKFDFRYHEFRDNNNSEKLGEEFDFDIIFKPHKKHTVMVRFADYTAIANSLVFTEDSRRIFLNYSYNL